LPTTSLVRPLNLQSAFADRSIFSIAALEGGFRLSSFLACYCCGVVDGCVAGGVVAGGVVDGCVVDGGVVVVPWSVVDG
jgi:hypothetical protein